MGNMAVCLAAACLLLSTPPVDGQGLQERLTRRRLASRTGDGRRDKDLNKTIEKVRRAFEERNTAELEGSFGAHKVFVSIKSRTGKAGYYTRSQLHFIFDKMFREVQTRSFKYSPENTTLSEDKRAFFRAQWTYVVLGSDTLVTEHLRFTLEKETKGWRISEIKASSR